MSTTRWGDGSEIFFQPFCIENCKNANNNINTETTKNKQTVKILWHFLNKWQNFKTINFHSVQTWPPLLYLLIKHHRNRCKQRLKLFLWKLALNINQRDILVIPHLNKK